MAKRRRRSDVVSFRLPIDVWPVFMGQADGDGLTRSEYAEKVVKLAVLQRKAQER